MAKEEEKRGGARSGAGRPPSHLILDKEAVSLLRKHMHLLRAIEQDPNITELEAIKRLLRQDQHAIQRNL